METKTLLEILEAHEKEKGERIDEKKERAPDWYKKQAKGAKKAQAGQVKCPKCGTMVDVD